MGKPREKNAIQSVNNEASDAIKSCGMNEQAMALVCSRQLTVEYQSGSEVRSCPSVVVTCIDSFYMVYRYPQGWIMRSRGPGQIRARGP